MKSTVSASLLCLLGLLGLLCGSSASAPEKTLIIPASKGFVELDLDTSRRYLETEDYLRRRLQEVNEVRVTSTYLQVMRSFRHDGGISSPPPHRFVNILCPYIKLDVTFQGETRGRPFDSIPENALVESVSKAYLETPYYD